MTEYIQLVWEPAYFDVTVRQCPVFDETMAHARVLSDTTHCPMMTSKPVCRTTVLDGRSGLLNKYNEQGVDGGLVVSGHFQ